MIVRLTRTWGLLLEPEFEWESEAQDGLEEHDDGCSGKLNQGE